MTFEELKEKDSFCAFDDWYSVKEAKEIGVIPEGFHSYFADKCTCGSDNIIKKSRTQAMCCNPKCSVKMGYALAETLTRFGVKGMKAASCSKIYEEMLKKDKQLKESGQKGFFEIGSFVECLSVPYSEYPASLVGTVLAANFYQACVEIRKEKITFPKLLSNLAIPELSKDAEKLFAGFQSFAEIANEIKQSGGVGMFCKLRGFNSPMVAFNVKYSARDMAAANMIFMNNIKEEGSLVLNVCMTGSISLNGQRTTKENYLKVINDMCIDAFGLTLLEVKMNSAKESNPFILYSRESGDSKFCVGKRRGIINDVFGEHEVLMHTDKFYEFLRRVMNEWNQRKSKDPNLDLLSNFTEIAKEKMQEIRQPKQNLQTTTSTLNLTELTSK